MLAPSLWVYPVGTVVLLDIGGGLEEVVAPLNSSSIPLPSLLGGNGVSVGLSVRRSVTVAVGTTSDTPVNNSLIRWFAATTSFSF